ncbi:hypothetical protein E4184_15705 [Aeromonas media]|uniref:Uncharacterized protein n=1 Tax=Aeromonas media TaxID=651 RepID=A0A6M4YDN8_AERME|nr:hypothetical protein E4184_15705 [Aeromonas media]
MLASTAHSSRAFAPAPWPCLGSSSLAHPVRQIAAGAACRPCQSPTRRGNGDLATRRHHREIQLWRAIGPVLSQREMFDINEIDSIKASLLVLND